MWGYEMTFKKKIGRNSEGVWTAARRLETAYCYAVQEVNALAVTSSDRGLQ
jgi:hypothetical protein